MISGTFDFFFATGGGNGVEGADGAWTTGCGCIAGTSTVVGAGGGGGGGGGGAAVTGGGGGEGGVGGAAGGFAISEVLGLD